MSVSTGCPEVGGESRGGVSCAVFEYGRGDSECCVVSNDKQREEYVTDDLVVCGRYLLTSSEFTL